MGGRGKDRTVGGTDEVDVGGMDVWFSPAEVGSGIYEE